jgi:hypothetical protein
MKLRSRDDVLLSFLITFTCAIAHNLVLTLILAALLSAVTLTRWDLYLHWHGVKNGGPSPAGRLGYIALTWLGGAACGLMAEVSYAILRAVDVIAGLMGLVASFALLYAIAARTSRLVNKLWATDP